VSFIDLGVPRVLLACVLLAIAAWTDIRTGRIPNSLNFTVMLLALLLGLLSGEWLWGVLPVLQGLLIGGGLLMPLYFLRLMGAGDVKLMAALGALVGWPVIGWVALFSLMWAGLLSVGLALYWKVGRSMLSNVHAGIFGLMHWRKLGRRASEALQVPLTGRRSPHAVAIGLGWLMYLVGRHWVRSGW
jgi:prepilin peptidase CpaA